MRRDEPYRIPEEQRISSVLCPESAPPSKGMSIIYFTKKKPLAASETKQSRGRKGP